MRTTWRQHWFLWAAAAILVGSTIVWSWTSARLQLGNSDQLVDGFLFRNLHTFHGAFFPSTHSQFIKWPLFVLVGLFNFSPAAYVALTIAVVVVTVVGVAYILYRIGRSNQAIVGGVYLMLAVILAMVPAQVSGVTSPLNMALLTGRNVEYLIYIGCLLLLIRMPRRRSWQALATIFTLSLLMASDQLFLDYSLLAAGLLVLMGLSIGHAQLRRTAISWLCISIAGTVLAELWLVIIGHSMTHIVDGSPGYTYVHTVYGIMQGLKGAVQALSINFGLTFRMGWIGFLGCGVSVCTMLAIAWAVVTIMRNLLREKKTLDTSEMLSVLLIMTTAAAIVLFAATSQPYLDNSRYLGISLFTGFIVLSTQLRRVEFRMRDVYAASGVLCIAATLAVIGGLQQANTIPTKSPLDQRDHTVAQLLIAHHVSYLVGNYWRVFPISMQAPMASQAVIPLRGCLNPTMILSSDAWRPDLRKQSFAYLLTGDTLGLPIAPCQRYFIESQYGRPTSVVVVSGTQHNPSEELLFYDAGADNRSQIRL